MTETTGQSDVAGPRGVPASGAGALIDLLAGDFDDRPRSAGLQMLDEELARGRRRGPAKTVQEAWVEDGSLVGGHWEVVS